MADMKRARVRRQWVWWRGLIQQAPAGQRRAVPTSGCPYLRGIGMRTRLGVRHIHRIAGVVVTHVAVLGVRPDGHVRRVDRQSGSWFRSGTGGHRDRRTTGSAASCPGPVRFLVPSCWVRTPPVRFHSDSRRGYGRASSCRLDQRVVTVRPHLGEIERIEPVGLGVEPHPQWVNASGERFWVKYHFITET